MTGEAAAWRAPEAAMSTRHMGLRAVVRSSRVLVSLRRRAALANGRPPLSVLR